MRSTSSLYSCSSCNKTTPVGHNFIWSVSLTRQISNVFGNFSSISNAVLSMMLSRLMSPHKSSVSVPVPIFFPIVRWRTNCSFVVVVITPPFAVVNIICSIWFRFHRVYWQQPNESNASSQPKWMKLKNRCCGNTIFFLRSWLFVQQHDSIQAELIISNRRKVETFNADKLKVDVVVDRYSRKKREKEKFKFL